MGIITSTSGQIYFAPTGEEFEVTQFNMNGVIAWPPHPAKYSDPMIPIFENILRGMVRKHATVLDPFAGVGNIHRLFPEFLTTGVEIEPRWSIQCPKLNDVYDVVRRGRTLTGDALTLCTDHPGWVGFFDAVVTSCTYGNRMADHHDAQETCKRCFGTGWLQITPVEEQCDRCGGSGKNEYIRMTYRHQYGEALQPNNSGAMPWGNKYREFHWLVWTQVFAVLRPNGIFILNVSDHIRKKEIVPVSAWHKEIIGAIGFKHLMTVPVPTKRMGYGANYDARVDHEDVHVFLKPTR